MANTFDQFDAAPVATAPNPFDQFEASPYSPSAVAKQRQDVVQSVAERRRLREESDAAALLPKLKIGVRVPFTDNVLASADIPAPVVAFGSEALKSAPGVAAGAAAASAAMPAALRAATALRAIPSPFTQLAAPVVQFGAPLVAGGVAAMGERAIQDEVLPRVLPENLKQVYDVSSEMAAANPNAALLGQIAGAGPFFRPGLPLNTSGAARIAVPAMTGAISGGIEGANQLVAGQFDPQRLAIATAGGALMNRETPLGARIAPNMVLPNITGGAPSELATVGQVMNESRLTQIDPAELDAMRLARNDVASEQIARQTKQAEAAKISSDAAANLRARALGERMMGQDAQGKLEILDQELRLNKDVITPKEERAGLEIKQFLKKQVEHQKLLEQAANEQQKAQAAQEKTAADAQKQIAEASKPPEIPESQKILAEPTAKPPVLANVATDIASHTEGSPFALQSKLNEMAQIAPAQPAVEPVPIGDRSGRPTGAAEEAIVAQMRKDAGLPEKAVPASKAPTPAATVKRIASLGPDEFFAWAEQQRPLGGFTQTAYTLGIAAKDDPGLIRSLKTAREAVNKESRVALDAGDLDKASSLSSKTQFFSEAISAAENKGSAVSAKDVTAAHQTPEATYDASTEEFRAASKKFTAVRNKYRAKEIGDAEFLAAKKEFDNAQSVADAAETAFIDAKNKTGEPINATNAGQQPKNDQLKYQGTTQGEDVRPNAGEVRQEPSQQTGGGNRPVGSEGQPPDVLQTAPEANGPAPAGAVSEAELKPVNTLKRPELRAELTAGGITKTPKGIPIEDANAAQLMDAVGKLRRGQLERGAISPRVLLPAGGAVAGGAAGYVTAPDQQPGESDEAYRARLLTRTAAGAAIGAGAMALGAMSHGAHARASLELRQIEESAARTDTEAVRAPRVSPPQPESGQGVRHLAERVIEDKKRATELRQKLAENPEIIYDKFLLNDLTDRVQAASPDELSKMRVSGDRNEQAAATIELANRADAEGRNQEAADLYAQASTLFTNSAQLLNVAKLVRSPIGYVTAIRDELKSVDRVLTQPQETKIREIATESIKADQKLSQAEGAARNDFSPENQRAFEAARNAAAAAKHRLADFVSQIVPKAMDDIIIQTIQGNLLTPLSQIANVYGNILFQPVRRGAMSIASGLDAIYSGITGEGRIIDRANPVPRMAELQAFADGTRVAAKELLSGPGVDSYVKGEVQRGFRPLRSLIQSFTGENLPLNSKGRISAYDRTKKFIEGTIGAPPEAMFRLLNLGDRGFRRAAEVETLLEQARLRGLKGRDLEKFIEFPDKATQELLNTEARKAIFAQENKGVSGLNTFLDSGLAKLLHLDQIPVAKGAIKIFGRLNVPFRQFPLNYVMTALNFAAPELALSKAAYYSVKGDRRAALTNIGEGIMGGIMYGGAAYLWKHGLISEPVDKDAKQRSIQYDNMGGQRINLSGLQRSLSGGNPAWQRDDTTVDWGRMGIPAPVFYVYTADQVKNTRALMQTGVRPPLDTSLSGTLFDRVKSYPGIGQFALDQSFLAGSSAFLEALKNGFTGPEADAWAANMFRATSTLAVPNTVEALARAQYQYIPELRGDTLSQTFKNIWDFKTFQLPKDDRALLKRDIWGQPVNRTPPNQNPYIYQFIDVSKAQARDQDPFKAGLVKIFNESNNPNAYPTLPDRSMSVQGVTAKLEPRDYETLQALTGHLRRQEAEPMVLDAEFNTIPAGERVAELEKVYSQAAADAKQTMLSDEAFRMKYFPEIYGGTPSERVVKRNTQARNRLEEQPATVPAPVAANPFDQFGTTR